MKCGSEGRATCHDGCYNHCSKSLGILEFVLDTIFQNCLSCCPGRTCNEHDGWQLALIVFRFSVYIKDLSLLLCQTDAVVRFRSAIFLMLTGSSIEVSTVIITQVAIKYVIAFQQDMDLYGRNMTYMYVCTTNPREALSSAYCDGATTKQLNISELHGLGPTGLYEVGLKLT